MVRKILISSILVFLTIISVYGQKKQAVTIAQQANASPRMRFGADRLLHALKNAGYDARLINNGQPVKGRLIIIGELSNALVKKAFSPERKPGKEGYVILSLKNGNMVIGGADPSGVLYGCLELAEQVKASRKLPDTIALTDYPEMILRGACIGVQKPYYLPGRTVYEYPYTPETFPWFYDKKLWIQYLDSLVDNRMNSLYLWNGHPFASLVRLKDYPYAVEVDDATFKKNEEIFRFLTTEADKRGIWVIQMFYNIIVSKPFAEHHKIKTQDRERPIIPLIADYTRKSIAAFVEKYPNVGLMVCLGEAMEGVGNDDIEWFTKTIIPGVQDGIKALGKTPARLNGRSGGAEPPIVLRAHDTDAPAVMKAALPLYKNLYTEAKFNGEALTTWAPRGKWAELHQTLSRAGSIHIENVHILANLEPFRYGSPDFIQRSVQGMLTIMEGRGLHLYPQASYWDWPYSADSVKGSRLLQIERDWIWYRAWSRYAWKSGRDRTDELDYWSQLLSSKYGCTAAQGRKIVEAYEESGEIAPKLLRRFGITDGNRQTLTLGMLMTQLINPYRYGLFTLLYESESPVGEMLIEYAEKEWKGEEHIGETPIVAALDVLEHGDKAVAAIEAVTATKNKEEFDRLKNDMYCYQALADHYAEKVEAALYILRYKYSNDIHDLEKALPVLQQSVESYKKLVRLTKGTYLYANSMQTGQRRIPIRGVNGTFKTWQEVLVPFEAELAHFKHSIDSLKQDAVKPATVVRRMLNADVSISTNPARFIIDSASEVFTDKDAGILRYAKELRSLRGIKLSAADQLKEGTTISFTAAKPVKLLVGFFKPERAAFAPRDTIYLKAPELETNASANDYGQAEIRIANGIVIKGMPSVNIHSYSFPAGTHTLKLAKGVCVIVGFVDGTETIPLYDAGLTESGYKKEIDWLFE
jgi:hypothetical protein